MTSLQVDKYIDFLLSSFPSYLVFLVFLDFLGFLDVLDFLGSSITSLHVDSLSIHSPPLRGGVGGEAVEGLGERLPFLPLKQVFDSIHVKVQREPKRLVKRVALRYGNDVTGVQREHTHLETGAHRKIL